ncbi:MAG TPA: hypothetical protein PKW05_08970 [Anaerolineae bacterium]|nr:hypothetical protein [Anaerolineae bacterium]HQJ51891.1 hypothetical protein [Anaerolineae bacterium]
MGTLDGVRKLFGRKVTLDSISLDELKREKARLELDERKHASRIDELEEEKKRLFMEGAREASTHKKGVLAGKIQEREADIKNVVRNLGVFSKQLRMVNWLIQIKTDRSLIEETGIIDIIAHLDLPELQKYFEKATVDGIVQMDRLTDMLRMADKSAEFAPLQPEDKDRQALIAAMEKAGAALQQDPEALDREYAQISKRHEGEEPEAEVS